MPKYIITKVERYEIESDHDPRTVLNHFHHFYNNLEEPIPLVMEEDNFEYLDGSDTIEESETE